MDQSIIGLLIQVPLVGAFMWFALRLLQIHRAEREERDREWREWLRGQHQDFRDFLVHERRQRDEAFSKSFGRLADEVKGLSGELARHDERAKSGIDEIIRAVRQSGATE